MDLLMVLIPCINYSHVVWMFKQMDHILLIKEEDYRQCETQLTASTILKTFTLHKLEKHAFLEFRLLNFLRSLIL